MSKRKEFLTKEGHIKANGKIRHTFTSTFLLPVVGTNRKEFGECFINAYIHKSEDNKPMLYVVCFNKEDDNSLITSIVKSRINPNFIDTETIEDELIIKFKIPEKAMDVYDLFIKGSYSKFPEQYKKYLVNIYGSDVIQENRYVTEYNVLYPQDYKRKQIAALLGPDINYKDIKEVFDIPDMKYETYIPLNKLPIEAQETVQERKSE